MASGTSYFNGTLCRKTISRFWPLWALWGVIWLFGGPLMMLNVYFNELAQSGPATARGDLFTQACYLPAELELGVWLAAVFGVLCAMAVFGYLYNNRSACMMHALPIRREGLFVTQYLAGLSMLLLPLAVVGVLILMIELAFLPSYQWGQALTGLVIWLLGLMGVSLFFFSFASFCAMFTGHILALPAFYGILNGLVFVIHALVTGLMDDFFYGYVPVWENGWVTALTPAYALTRACRFQMEYQWEADGAPLDVPVVTAYGINSPLTVAAYAAVGVALALAALAVYRRRHVETAGDVVSVAVVRPIFKYGVALCAGLSLGMFTAAFFGWYYNSNVLLVVSTLVWTAVGYFVAEMLLKKTFRVFKAWKGCVAAVAVMALLCAVCAFDLLGVESRVPDPGQVAKVEVTLDIGLNRRGSLICTGDDQELLEQMTQLHRAIVSGKDQFEHGSSGDDFFYLYLTYTLDNGTVLSRQYHSVPLNREELEQEGSITWCTAQLAQNQELWEKLYDFDHYEQGQLESVILNEVYNQQEGYVTADYLDLSSSQALELWQAVRADFNAGSLGARPLFAEDRDSYMTTIGFEWRVSNGGRVQRWETLEVSLWPGMTNTLACLEELGATGEVYQLMDQYGNPVE